MAEVLYILVGEMKNLKDTSRMRKDFRDKKTLCNLDEQKKRNIPEDREAVSYGYRTLITNFIKYDKYIRYI